MQATHTRLATAPVSAVVPASDIERARKFYHEKLGLDVDEFPGGMFMAHAGEGTMLLAYETEATSHATVAGFKVDDLEATMAELRQNGVVFEEYDMPGLKTVN